VAAAGEILYRQQDASFALLVILKGRIAVIDDFGGAHERVVVEHGPRMFTGGYNLLAGRASFLPGWRLSRRFWWRSSQAGCES
jgi:hypothetical protein